MYKVLLDAPAIDCAHRFHGFARYVNPRYSHNSDLACLIPILTPELYRHSLSRIYYAWAKYAYDNVSGVIAISHAKKISH